MGLNINQHHEVPLVRFYDTVVKLVSEKNVGSNIFSPRSSGLHIFASLFCFYKCPLLNLRKYMAGIYIHIPFCKTRCSYCNFYSETSVQLMPALLEAVKKEMILKKEYLGNAWIDSVYLGGGTPSLLSATDVEKLMEALGSCFSLSSGCEITLEANPDDLSGDLMADFRSAGVNRISLGIQSFFDRDLHYLQRRHDGQKALDAVNVVMSAGFTSVSADLIYSIPGQTSEMLQKNLELLVQAGIPHISCYSLTVEPGTPLEKMISEGIRENTGEDHFLSHFYKMTTFLREAGFLHYEISNFALPDHLARHNTHYWFQIPYLGLGPSAHSYNGTSRQWNPSSLSAYMHQVSKGLEMGEREWLDDATLHNEYLMTRLRTMWGVEGDAFCEKFGISLWHRLGKLVQPFVIEGLIKENHQGMVLTDQGMVVSDRILSSLFL